MEFNNMMIIQHAKRLPKDVTSIILLYLLGIRRELAEDIQHFVKCRRMIENYNIVYNSDDVLETVYHAMYNLRLLDKYTRQMLCESEDIELYEYDDGQKHYVITDNICKKKLESYLWNVPREGIDVDARPNKYSVIAAEHDNNTYIMGHYRVIHNVLSQMSIKDRSSIMTRIVRSRYGWA